MIGGSGIDMRFAIFAGALAMFVSSCASEASCENELRGRWPSPDAKATVVTFMRNCGATVGDNYQVSIVSGAETPSGAGNALVVDQVPSYSDNLTPIWNGSSSVTVPIPTGSRVFMRNENVGGVRVIFEQL
jgi:hypothetical protein